MLLRLPVRRRRRSGPRADHVAPQRGGRRGRDPARRHHRRRHAAPGDPAGADALAAAPGIPVGLHLHNTRNTGYANAYAGLEAGATLLDASIGGLGGCPFAPRATGNIATEDLVYLLDGLGVEHGCDLDELIRVSEWLEAVLGHELPGLLHRAGRFPA